MNFLFRFLKKKNLSEDKILNLGLNYAMEFGTNWLQPIQARLSKKLPYLTNQELDRFDELSRGAMNIGHNFVYERLARLSNDNQTIASNQLTREFESFMKEKFPWVSNSNLKRLLGQSIYYAWKDGLDKTIT